MQFEKGGTNPPPNDGWQRLGSGVEFLEIKSYNSVSGPRSNIYS
jgi:hypothetical protein